MKSFSVSLFLFLASVLHAQKPVLPGDVRDNLEQRIKVANYPAIVVGMVNAMGTSFYSFGVKKEGGQPVDEHSIFEIGSISKTFTSTLLAEEVLKGEMSLDDPAQKYLPDSVHLPMYNDQAITLGNLCDHTSSLPRMPDNFDPADPMNPYADYTVDQLYQFLSGYKLNRPIGSEYEYSNLGVGLLGQIISRKTGTPYEELLISRITRPLQMDETKITLDDNMKKNLAFGHASGIQVENWDIPAMAGAGAIRSSAYDMIKYVSAEMNLTPSPLHEAMSLTHKQRHNKVGGNGLGMAWFIDYDDALAIYNHGGATGGYRTFVGFTDSLGVVVLTNTDEDIEDVGMHLLDPAIPIQEVRPKLSQWIMETIDKYGAKSLLSRYAKLKKENGAYYDIDENEINTLGYRYMNERKDLEAAKAIFKINIQEFPASFNVYDSYGEALMNDGNKKDAITNYKKSMELNPDNMNGMDMLAKMGVKYDVPAPEISEALLATYDGTYELVEGFNLVITHQDNRLFGQATGQMQFELFPRSETEFYLKVTEASVKFSKNTEGVMGLTLYQNGAVLPGKKL
jgi:D-alanyl-D-alanine-carboxypeptidase/D-alanyl-D-alanine-endopeptidase